MRLLVQRVKNARISVENSVCGQIASGLLAYLAVHREDTGSDAEFLAHKLVNLRIFEDSEGKMNLSALDLGLGILVVSQFTLYGSVRKGFRPNFMESMEPGKAEDYYRLFIDLLNKSPLKIQSGVFGAMMQVSYINDGPVSIIIDSRNHTSNATRHT